MGAQIAHAVSRAEMGLLRQAKLVLGGALDLAGLDRECGTEEILESLQAEAGRSVAELSFTAKRRGGEEVEVGACCVLYDGISRSREYSYEGEVSIRVGEDEEHDFRFRSYRSGYCWIEVDEPSPRPWGPLRVILAGPRAGQ